MPEAPASGSRSGNTSHPGKPRGTPVYSVDAAEFVEAIQRPRRLSDEAPPHKGRLPPLNIPSFGEPTDDCGQYIPAAMWWCPGCAAVHEKKHVCNRYDCPMHWAHAVRRRAAGSKDAAGVAPQLDALRRYLNAYRDDNQYFHHLVYSPPRDRLIEAKNPLKRELEVVRELMDVMGIQGVVAYHPWSGKNEDHERDDRGEWRKRIGKDTEWDAVREELQYRPHFHIIGVAPFIDFSETPKVNEETDAVLHRITQEDPNISIEDNRAMCRAATYALSHAGIYDTKEGQRRLAAWMKGPDIHRVSPLDKNKSHIQATVYDVARDTLGIEPPNLVCDEKPPAESMDSIDDNLPGIDRPSEQRADPLTELYGQGQDPGTKPGAHVDQDTITVHSSPGPSGGQGTGADLGSFRSFTNPDRDDLDTWNPASSSSASSSTTRSGTSSSSTSTSGSDDVGARDQDVVDEEPTCGTRLRHISKAGEYLLDPEWNERQDPEAIADLEAAYQSYVDWMTSKGYHPSEDAFTLPEEQPIDRPPDD